MEEQADRVPMATGHGRNKFHRNKKELLMSPDQGPEECWWGLAGLGCAGALLGTSRLLSPCDLKEILDEKNNGFHGPSKHTHKLVLGLRDTM